MLCGLITVELNIILGCCYLSGLSMGVLGNGNSNGELENVAVSFHCDEVGFEEETNTSAIESAVKVLLLDLGEDINREGLRKTPLRVAKAFSEGTRGDYPIPAELTFLD